MPSVSPIKNSPIAKYLVKNEVPNFVEFRNKNNQVVGTLRRGNTPLNRLSFISIDLFKPNETTPFFSQNTFIKKTLRYFYEQHKFLPVKIEIQKYLRDFQLNRLKGDILTRGLASNLYIEQIKESDAIIKERTKAKLPKDCPIYTINKPFKYEFKAHLYHLDKPIDNTRPML